MNARNIRRVNGHRYPPTSFTEIHTKELDIKGTWKRNFNVNESTFAAICCPECGNAFGVSRLNHRIDSAGLVSPLYQCPFVPKKRCSFEGVLQLKGWMPLFAIACERFRINKEGKPTFVPEIFYLHAESAQKATAEYHNSKAPQDRLVGISIVVGYNVEDKEGKVVSV